MHGGKPKAQMNKSSESGQQSPRQNHLLAALPAAVYRRLLPALELVTLPLGQVLFPPARKVQYVYFPTTGLITLPCTFDQGVSSQAWPIGNEGVVGLALLSGPIRNDRAEVQLAGGAFRLSVDALRAEFMRGGAFQELLLRYLQAFIMKVSQLGVCNQHHTLDQRLCRDLLHAFNRVPANELAITHQQAADSLGVRRVGVTEAVGRLQAAGIIRCGRGQIKLLNRRQLNARACECYAVIKKEFDGLRSSWLTPAGSRVRNSTVD
jgi:hypothetical protein